MAGLATRYAPLLAGFAAGGLLGVGVPRLVDYKHAELREACVTVEELVEREALVQDRQAQALAKLTDLLKAEATARMADAVRLAQLETTLTETRENVQDIATSDLLWRLTGVGLLFMGAVTGCLALAK